MDNPQQTYNEPQTANDVRARAEMVRRNIRNRQPRNTVFLALVQAPYESDGIGCALEDILDAVAKSSGIECSEIVGAFCKNKPERHVAAWLMKTLTRATFRHICHALGDEKNSVALYGFLTVEKNREKYQHAIQAAHKLLLQRNQNKRSVRAAILTCEAMGDEVCREKQPPMLKDILEAVSVMSDFPVGHLTSHRRFRLLCESRHIAMWLMKELTSDSYPQIGRACGGRDHSTVMHGVDRVKKDFAYFEPRIEAAKRCLADMKRSHN